MEIRDRMSGNLRRCVGRPGRGPPSASADARGGAPGKSDSTDCDTTLPVSHGSIGSATMANAGASILLAANAVPHKAIELALTGRDAPFAGAVAHDIIAVDGRLVWVPTTWRSPTPSC